MKGVPEPELGPRVAFQASPAVFASSSLLRGFTRFLAATVLAHRTPHAMQTVKAFQSQKQIHRFCCPCELLGKGAHVY